MFRKQFTTHSSENEAESPWISFTDLMAGFLVVILLALAAAIIMLTMEKAHLEDQREQFEAELVDAKRAREEAENKKREAQDAYKRAKESEKAAMLAKENALQISKDFITLFEELRASQHDIDKTVHRMDSFEQTRKQLLKSMQTSLAEMNIHIEISKTGEIMHISEDNLSFDLGKYDIADRFKPTMEAIGSEISQKLQTKQGQIIDTVFVEGHTDNVPNRQDMGNWGLSSYRAISLWNFWSDSDKDAGKLKSLKNTENKAMFSVTGYGETRPLKAFPPGFDGDQRVNRRIDLRFNLQTAKKYLLVELSQKVSRSTKKFDRAYEELKSKLNTLTEDAKQR